MKPQKYYIRVSLEDNEKFREHLVKNGIVESFTSIIDLVTEKGGHLYSLNLTNDQAMIIKLSFNLRGCLNIQKALNAQVARTKNIVAFTASSIVK